MYFVLLIRNIFNWKIRQLYSLRIGFLALCSLWWLFIFPSSKKRPVYHKSTSRDRQKQANILALFTNYLPPKTNIHLHLNTNGAFQHVAPGLTPLQLTSGLKQSKRWSMNNNLIIFQFLLQIHQMASDDFQFSIWEVWTTHFYGAFLVPFGASSSINHCRF